MEADIKKRYTRDAAERQNRLDTIALCSALTDPSVFPPEAAHENHSEFSHNKRLRLPETYTSVGARGITILEGLMTSALYPVTQPFFELAPPIRIENDLVSRDDGSYEQYMQELAGIELAAMAILESAGADEQSNRRPFGFRSRKSIAIRQALIAGDVLEKMGDDYRVRPFRPDQYVTRRDSAGDVLYHITSERVDMLSLTDEQRAAAEIDIDDYKGRDPLKRMETIYTLIEWNPQSKRWVISQQVRNGLIPNSKGEMSTEETVSPYFSTAFKLAPNEDYGRGFIEVNCLGDLRSLNELQRHRLNLLYLAAKQHPALDHASQLQENDLLEETGVPIRARVEGGQVQDVAPFSFGTIADYQMLTQGVQTYTQDLARTMLIESASAPNKDRVTATQIQRIAQELEGALGGVYTQIADDQQRPLVARTLYQMQRDGIIESITSDGENLVEIKTLTGLVALQREAQRVKLLDFAQYVQMFGDQGMARIDLDVALSVYQRLQSIKMPGLVKSPEAVAAEEQARLQSVAAERGIDAVGTIAENTAAQAAQQGAQ